jgi:YggT family protein
MSAGGAAATAEDRSMGAALVWLFNTLITLYIWVIIIMAVLSWLIAFNVINARNPYVNRVLAFVAAITEPALRPIRKVIPLLGGVDLSPIVLILALQFIQILFMLAGPLISMLG